MIEFTVSFVAVEEAQDLNAFVVFLYEQPDGTGERLEIQRALEYDEQDREAGMDTYCLCTSTGASHYGGVVSYRLGRWVLEILLDDGAAGELSIQAGYRLNLSLDDAAWSKLSDALSRVLDDDGG